MRIVSFLLLLGMLTCFASGTARAGSGEEQAAASAARVWLSLIDVGYYARSWKEASAYFQGGIDENGWKASLNGARKPLGRLVSRRLQTAKYVTELPGAPDGQYVVMQFRTSFVNKRAAIETVTFMLDNDRKWRAAGYFIK
jgi:hypothetical protein